MLRLSVHHASINHSHGDFLSTLSRFDELRGKLVRSNPGFLHAPKHTELLEEIDEKLRLLKHKFSHIVILGIGGSGLGGKMLVDSLSYNHGKKLIFLENIDPYEIAGVTKRLPLINTLFLVISKSGNTPETLAQFFHFKKCLREVGLKPQDHMILITDPETGSLREAAQMDRYLSFAVPKEVGGRFSVLTAVGLVLGYLIDIDTRRLLQGAGSVVSQIYQAEPRECVPFMLACVQYYEYLHGKPIHVLMPYSERLRKFGNWYSQLLAESIGKTPKIGLTPLPAVGTTDQHSQLQLFQDGPKDKLIMFIHILYHGTVVEIPDNHFSNLSFLNNHSFNELMEAEYFGTRDSLTAKKIPNLTLTISELTPFSIGELIMTCELSIAFLGLLFEIDAYNQPGVEESKKKAREYLEKKY
jgi:glucose-6-phosphate isomerase